MFQGSVGILLEKRKGLPSNYKVGPLSHQFFSGEITPLVRVK